MSGKFFLCNISINFFGKNFKFHSNLNIPKNSLLYFIYVYRRYNKQPKFILFKNHHLIKSNQIHFVEILTAKELYLISVQHEMTTPTSKKYFDSIFKDLTSQWKHICTLPRITTIDSKLRCFQYKILFNTLYLNQKLFYFVNIKYLTFFIMFMFQEVQKFFLLNPS